MSAIIATLIANPERSDLTQTLIDKAAKAVNATDISVLAENIAVDIGLPQEAGEGEVRTALEQSLAGCPIDIIIQPFEGRRKKLLLADMDSTIIGQECIDELAREVGLGEEISAQTQRAMRGEIDFDSALRQRVEVLRDLPLSVIDEVIAKRLTLTPGAGALIATMRRNGAYTALVSGGFSLFTEKIAAQVGFDENCANILCHDGEKLTGKVADPILGAEAKRQKLLELCQKLGCTSSQVMAVGDGANDILMLQQAGSGVAFHAKPKVREAASMQVNHGDLTAILYLQGYKMADFVAP